MVRRLPAALPLSRTSALPTDGLAGAARGGHVTSGADRGDQHQRGATPRIRNARTSGCRCACGCSNWVNVSAEVCHVCVMGKHGRGAELSERLAAVRAAMASPPPNPSEQRVANRARQGARQPRVDVPPRPAASPTPVTLPTAAEIQAMLSRSPRPATWCSCSCGCSRRHVDGAQCLGCINGRHLGATATAARLLALKAKYAK